MPRVLLGLCHTTSGRSTRLLLALWYTLSSFQQFYSKLTVALNYKTWQVAEERSGSFFSWDGQLQNSIQEHQASNKFSQSAGFVSTVLDLFWRIVSQHQLPVGWDLLLLHYPDRAYCFPENPDVICSSLKVSCNWFCLPVLASLKCMQERNLSEKCRVFGGVLVRNSFC